MSRFIHDNDPGKGARLDQQKAEIIQEIRKAKGAVYVAIVDQWHEDTEEERLTEHIFVDSAEYFLPFFHAIANRVQEAALRFVIECEMQRRKESD